MKRTAMILLTGLLCLSLTGCGKKFPEQAADGTPWDSSWVLVGDLLGVDTPAGMDSRENDDIMTKNNLYYAAWSIGDSELYVNSYGRDSALYDAQLFLLLAGYQDAAAAEANRQDFLAMAYEQYQTEDTFEAVYNGQTFTVITYTFASDTNPYERGASAFGTYRNFVVSAELSCREQFGGDALPILEDFLEHCHYAV